MNATRLVRYYTAVLKALLFAVPFLSLYIARSMFFPYITGRNFAFRIIVELALIAWVVLLAVSREHRPRFTPLLIAIASFTVVVGIADLAGMNPFDSFWSRYERMEGYLTILHLFGYFLMLGTILKTRGEWQAFFTAFLGVGVIAGLYGIFQKLGFLASVQGGIRIDGTIGNPTYLATYLLLLLILTLVLSVQAKARVWRWVYGGIGAYFVGIIFLTASRGPLLALILGTLLVSLLYVLYADRKDPSVRRKRFVAMAVLAAAIVIPVGFSLVRNSRFAHSNYVFDRFADISFTEKTTRSRFMIWAMSWEGFKERPILGWGQESYTAVFSKYYNPKLYDQEPWFDRAHNIVFDWLINAGIVGLLAYLAMFVFAFRVLWRGFRSGTIDLPTSAILSAGLVAYFFQNLFVFDNFNSYIVFFAILAYLWRLELGLVRASQPLGLGNVPWVKPMVAFGGALLVFGGAIYAVNIRPMQESSGIIDILKSAGNAEPAQVAKEFDRVLGYRTFGNKEVIEQYLRLASDLVVAASIPNEKKLPFVEGALAATEQHLERFPNDVRMRMAIATLYNRATAISLAYAPKARVHIEEAIRLGPNRQQAYFASAENYLVAGQLDAALAVMQKAVELEPNFVDAHMNLGVIAVYAGKHDIVAREVLEIRALAPDSIEPILKIASIYVKVQNFARALDLYKIIVEIDPSIAEHHANLAALYHQQGFKQDAIREAKKAAELDPQNYGASAEKFLKEIGG